MKGIEKDKLSRPQLSRDDLVKALLAGKDISYCEIDDKQEVDKCNKFANELGMDKLHIKHLTDITDDYKIYHNERSAFWFIPDKYKKINVSEYLLSKCTTQEEIDRVNYELALYKERDLYDLLRFCIFLVDYMRENNILWGVGRGSSVSSYCLYLIGIHRINSLMYELSIKEFLK